MAAPLHITDDTFEDKVLKSPRPVVVDFWAPWCSPCLAIAPVLEKIAEEFDGRLAVVKINVDDHPRWAGQHGVQSIPTLLMFAGGKLVHRQVGAVPAPYLRKVVEEFLRVVEAPASPA